MRTKIVLGLAVLVLTAGCASTRNDPYATGDGSKKDACERSGGYWQPSPGVCDRPKS